MIKKFLSNRRYVFFRKYPDPVKQQCIINAEARLSVLERCSSDELKIKLSKYADLYILPLIPGQGSRLYDPFIKFYHQLKSQQ